MMYLKVCGMRESDNIKQLLELPINAMGLIFYKKSPRNVIEKTFDESLFFEKKIAKVGVFVNENIDFIKEKIDTFGLNVIQLHGNETAAYINILKKEIGNLEIWKAFGIDKHFNFENVESYQHNVDKFLFDTKSPQYGGLGVTFDWEILKKYKYDTPFILSGGIDETMVFDIKALNIKQLCGIDLNSRFEISPAFKDIKKIENFIKSLCC